MANFSVLGMQPHPYAIRLWAAVNTVHTQHSTKLVKRNPVICLIEVGKACEDVFIILPRFLDILLESEMLSVLLRPGQKTHWVSFSFD